MLIFVEKIPTLPRTYTFIPLTGNESVPKIIINNTIQSFKKNILIISLVISNYNSFRVLSGKIIKLLPYVLFEKYIFIFLH